MSASVFDFGEFPALCTERLLLREPDPSDVQDIFAVRSDPEAQRENSKPHKTLDETLGFIATERERYQQRQTITWTLTLRDSGRVVGWVSVLDWKLHHRRAGIAYDLAKDCWGQGLAQEGLRAVMRFGFEKMGLDRLEVWTSAANARSLRLAQRLGFVREGSLRHRIVEDDGQRTDCAVFGLLKSEWESGLNTARLSPQASTAEYVARVNRVIDHIDKHLGQLLPLAELAEIAHFSKYHFHRIFSAMVGETLNQFVQRLRLEKAANQLGANPSVSITEVALDCGFSSSATFARAFKSAFNMNPTQWRERCDRKGGMAMSKASTPLRNLGNATGHCTAYVHSKTNKPTWEYEMSTNAGARR